MTKKTEQTVFPAAPAGILPDAPEHNGYKAEMIGQGKENPVPATGSVPCGKTAPTAPAGTPTGRFASLVLLAAAKQTLKKAVLSKPDDKSVVRTVITPKVIGKKQVLQAETFLSDNKATHENIPMDGSSEERIAEIVSGFGEANLLTTAGNCERKRSKSGTETLLHGDALEKALRAGVASSLSYDGNDRQKARILTGDEPFLKLLGVSDKNGRVYDKKQAKFRQINRFLELLRDVEDKLPEDGTLRICDLCCGKSYLSFAVYHYFAHIRGREVRMTGVDLKPDVIAYCNDVAEKLHFDGLTFRHGDIGKYDAEEHVHLVVSLHACDTATDLVLAKAVAWGAEVILSTPCCHHELNHTLQCPELSFIAEHSMLRQKFCDAATDALRLKLLESEGYAVAALELIDPEETPKNIMLRAVKKKHFDKESEEAKALRDEYQAAKRFLVRSRFYV